MKNWKLEAKKISRWMYEYAENAKAKGYVIGLSGGVDSAVVAALAADAVGADNVFGVIMPIESRGDDRLDAELVAQELGIKYTVVELENTFRAMQKAFPVKQKKIETQANTKARLRMTMLYNFAGEMGYLVAGTGNRSEDAVGYFTKYGDGGVDILPIAEYYKHEIREIAEMFGFPETIYNRTSTAGLWDGQPDEEDLGISYDDLDAILSFIDGYTDGSELTEQQFNDIPFVVNLINKNKHKAEYPPIFKRG